MNRSTTPHTAARRRLLLILLGWGSIHALAAPHEPRELRVITGPDSASQRQILQALKARFPMLVSDVDPTTLDARKGPAVYVSIGPAALKRALGAELKGPLISMFTSSMTYRQLLGRAGSTERDRSGVTAIYADAAPQAQLQLINALFERHVTAGVLLSEASAYLEKPLRQAAAQAGIDLLLEWPGQASDVVRAITKFGGAQVLLAVPDSTLYTPDTLRSVLESTYRRGLPVIGFSSATVAAGTLATAYADIDDGVADLAELLEWLGNQSGNALPEPRFARYWRVSVNESVARSLGIAITDKVLNLGNHPTGRPG